MRPDIQTIFVRRDGIRGNRLERTDFARIEIKNIGDRAINRKNNLCCTLFQQVLGQINFIFFQQRFSDLLTLRFKKGIGHPAADNDLVNPGQQIGNNIDFTGYLGTA